MKPIPTIEYLFEVYLLTSAKNEVDFEEQRRPFFCGFEACLRAMDSLSEIAWEDADEGDLAWQRLHAEFDKFATETDRGGSAVNH